MIICKACATRNPDSAEFCVSCGRYLAWSGERVDLEPEGPVVSDPEITPDEPAPAPIGMLRRLLVAMHLAGGGPRHDPAAQAPQGATTSGTLTRPSGTGQAAGPDDATPTTIDVPFELARTIPAAPASGAEEFPDAPVVNGDDTGFVPVIPRLDGDPLSVGRTTHHLGDEGVPATAGSRDAELVTAPRPGEQLSSIAPRRPGEGTGARAFADPGGGAAERPKGFDGDVVPVGSSTALRRPTEVAPTTRARKKAVAVVVPDVPLTASPGDVFCPRCNQFNAPTRVFCRRCGTALAAPPDDRATLDYVSLNWWQRHFGRDTEIVGAGARPGRWGKAVSGGGGQGWLMRVAARAGAGVVALGILLSFVGPTAQPLRDWFTRTYDSVAHRVNVTYNQQFAIGANASSEVSAHPAADAVDDASTTWWQTADVVVPKAVKGKVKPKAPAKAPVPGVGARLTVVFAEPTTINRIGVLSGAAGSPQAFLGEARPREVLLTFTGGYTVREHLKDTQNFQQFAIDAQKVTSMSMVVLSVYPSPTGKAMALTEIEFFQRQ